SAVMNNLGISEFTSADSTAKSSCDISGGDASTISPAACASTVSLAEAQPPKLAPARIILSAPCARMKLIAPRRSSTKGLSAASLVGPVSVHPRHGYGIVMSPCAAVSWANSRQPGLQLPITEKI